MNLYNITKKPILVAITVGRCATDMETKEDQLVLWEAISALKRMFGDTKISKLIYFNRTRWFTDKYSRGSFSHIVVGGSGNDYDLLSCPINNKLFFAGEATNRHHPTTVSGAILSGIREAGRISQIFSPAPKALDIQKRLEISQLYVSFSRLKSRKLSFNNNHSNDKKSKSNELDETTLKLLELASYIPTLEDIIDLSVSLYKEYNIECTSPVIQTNLELNGTNTETHYNHLMIYPIVLGKY